MNMTASSARADSALLLDAPLPSVRGFEPQDEAAWKASSSRKATRLSSIAPAGAA